MRKAAKRLVTVRNLISSFLIIIAFALIATFAIVREKTPSTSVYRDYPVGVLRGHALKIQQEADTVTLAENATWNSINHRRLGQSENTLSLPQASQSWSKEVNSQHKLGIILGFGSRFSAIEGDLLVGQCTSCADPNANTPIMAHPPETSSDLSVESFLDRVSELDPTTGTRSMNHNVKLDFKSSDVVEPTLTQIVNTNFDTTTTSEVFFLNADLVPGPGFGSDDIDTDPNVFIPLGLAAIQQQIANTGSTNMAWSLGFRTRYEDLGAGGYQAQDLERMGAVIQQYNLLDSTTTSGTGRGVVLAMNARQLAKNLNVVSSAFLEGGRFASTTASQLQILAWTGRTECAIPRSTVELIREHFEQNNLADRIGFDVLVEESIVLGFALETCVCFYGIFNPIFTC